MGTGSSRSLFSVDSIGYQTFSWTVGVGMYTTCGEPKDHYEFGYNGQMKSNEIAGMGNHYEFKYREYDPRIGRFWSVDPLHNTYPWNSTYAFAENDVIRAMDLEGLEKYIVTNYYVDGRHVKVTVHYCKDQTGTVVDLDVKNGKTRLTNKDVLVINVDMKGANNDQLATRPFHRQADEKDALNEIEQNIMENAALHCPNNDPLHPAHAVGKMSFPEDEADRKFIHWHDGDKIKEHTHFHNSMYMPRFGNFRFYQNNTVLKPIGNPQKSLASIALFLKEHPDFSIQVTGTSNQRLQKSEDMNISGETMRTTFEVLSEFRADLIIKTLIRDYRVNAAQLIKMPATPSQTGDGGVTVKPIPTPKPASNNLR